MSLYPKRVDGVESPRSRNLVEPAIAWGVIAVMVSPFREGTHQPHVEPGNYLPPPVVQEMAVTTTAPPISLGSPYWR